MKKILLVKDSHDYLIKQFCLRQKINLIYIDPPFNTKKIQKRGVIYYIDHQTNYHEFIKRYLILCRMLLTNDGSFFIHLDQHEVFNIKPLCDQIFGEENFKNVICWTYDYGGKSKSIWSNKTDFILWYTHDPKNYTFNYDAIDRIPYESKAFISEEKFKRGKIPTNNWKITIVPTNSKENTKYPNQKPLKLLNRIVRVHSNPHDLLMDCFAGSGSFGVAAELHSRNFILLDNNIQAYDVMKKRFEPYKDVEFIKK